MDIEAAKTEINFRLDREIMGGTDVVPDRLNDVDSFKLIRVAEDRSVYG